MHKPGIEIRLSKTTYSHFTDWADAFYVLSHIFPSQWPSCVVELQRLQLVSRLGDTAGSSLGPKIDYRDWGFSFSPKFLVEIPG
jgi:hypothetical protein